MGRKNLLKNLMEAEVEIKSAKPSRTRPTSGAIGAVSQSIAELKARSIEDIDPNLIDAGGLYDRLEQNSADHAALIASIRDYGQQVPVLVRPHPENDGRFEIVYGRRRVAALRELGLPVKAMIRGLDDREAVLAQGQENSARRDLSFIEKVNFARQMRDAGYERKVICDALDIDKTLVSRMLSVADRTAIELIEAIGSAPSIGRDRWIALADLVEASDRSISELAELARGANSDDRFAALVTALTLPHQPAKGADPAKPMPHVLTTDGGRKLGEAKLTEKKTTLTFTTKDAAGFDTWLVDNIDRIHREWMSAHDDETGA